INRSMKALPVLTRLPGRGVSPMRLFELVLLVCLVAVIAMASGRQSMEFQDQPLSEVTELVGERLQTRVYVCPEVKGTADGTYYGTPREILDQVLEPLGYASVTDGGYLVVGPPGQCRVPTVSLSLHDEEVVQVVKTLAKAMGRNVFVGPTVEGQVTIELADVPAPEALDRVLAELPSEYVYKMRGSTLLVAAPEKLVEILPACLIEDELVSRPEPPPESIRQEILLERAPAAKVMEYLFQRYPEVKFSPHPTMKGFYVEGSREDILAIKRAIPGLDRAPSPPPKVVTVKLGLRNLKPSKAAEVLRMLMPDVTFTTDERAVVATGVPDAIQQAHELLVEIDRLPERAEEK
ncbi:MAG: hypothetical protein KC910_30135, partial [Candidatus Eremiobacteraeota bacterium]|nr:hypothetical protein [Candidatus Eremiobacteraeota bacterium]